MGGRRAGSHQPTQQSRSFSWCTQGKTVKTISTSTANGSSKTENPSPEETLVTKPKFRKRLISRRAFLGKSLAMGAGTIGVGLMTNPRSAEAINGGLTQGDAALLRFPAALELLEADFWIQYNELAGVQDDEVPGGTGNKSYTEALEVLDEDMAQ